MSLHTYVYTTVFECYIIQTCISIKIPYGLWQEISVLYNIRHEFLTINLLNFIEIVSSTCGYTLLQKNNKNAISSSSSPNLFPSIWTTSDRSVSLHHPNLISYSEFRPIIKAALDG